MNHLEEVNMTYFNHLQHAISYSFISFYAGFIFIIHGFFPNILVHNGSTIINRLNILLQPNLLLV